MKEENKENKKRGRNRIAKWYLYTFFGVTAALLLFASSNFLKEEKVRETKAQMSQYRSDDVLNLSQSSVSNNMPDSNSEGSLPNGKSDKSSDKGSIDNTESQNNTIRDERFYIGPQHFSLWASVLSVIFVAFSFIGIWKIDKEVEESKRTISEFKDEMKEFKDKMDASKENMRITLHKMNKLETTARKWQEIKDLFFFESEMSQSEFLSKLENYRDLVTFQPDDEKDEIQQKQRIINYICRNLLTFNKELEDDLLLRRMNLIISFCKDECADQQTAFLYSGIAFYHEAEVLIRKNDKREEGLRAYHYAEEDLDKALVNAQENKNSDAEKYAGFVLSKVLVGRFKASSFNKNNENLESNYSAAIKQIKSTL